MSDPKPAGPVMPIEETENAPPSSAFLKAQPVTWFQRLSSVLFIVFCLELGLVLLIYPWISTWGMNFFAWAALPESLQKAWNMAWNNPYFRGAVSGLGVLNFWIALTETFRLLSRR